MAGIQYSEEIVEREMEEHVDEYDMWDADGPWETVAKSYSAEELHCPVCDLHLKGEAELDAADIDPEHLEYEEREAEFEPDYGND